MDIASSSSYSAELTNSKIATNSLEITLTKNDLIASSSATTSSSLISESNNNSSSITDPSKSNEFLIGNAQILATIIAVGFSIYIFVLGMKLSRLSLKVILKKEKVVWKFGSSLIFVGILSFCSIFSIKNIDVIYFLYALVFIFYIITSYWLVWLSKSLIAYLSPDKVANLIELNLREAIKNAYKVEIQQLKITDDFMQACEEGGIDVFPGFSSLYEPKSQTAIFSSKSGYINGYDRNILGRIIQLIHPSLESETISDSLSPRELATKSRRKVRIFQGISYYIDVSSANESLRVIASIEKNTENSSELSQLLGNLFEVGKKNKYATEINELLIDLKRHVLEVIQQKNLDEYKSDLLIFPALLKEHYKLCQEEKNHEQKSLSYLSPIREIIGELMEITLKSKDQQWIGITTTLFYTVLTMSVENNDIFLFQDTVTLFKTLYKIGNEFSLKPSLWRSHHLLYEILNYHLIPQVEKSLADANSQDEKEKIINNAKLFIWSMLVNLSENLKAAYQLNDFDHINSVTLMLNGSLKYTGEFGDNRELESLKKWYKNSLIKLWLNQVAYAFEFKDKRNKYDKKSFDLIISNAKSYSVEDLSMVTLNQDKSEARFKFPDFDEFMFTEEAEYSGTAVFMGDPNTGSFKSYVATVLSKVDLNNQKSVAISQYFSDELKKLIESFKSGIYKDLIGKIKTVTSDEFLNINERALTEYKNSVENEVINAQLDSSLVNRFEQNVIKGWVASSSLRVLLKKQRKFVKKLNECPEPVGGILLNGFNQRYSKEYFIQQDRFGFPQQFGTEYGKALSNNEDMIIAEKLESSVAPIDLNVSGKKAEEIIEEVLSSFDIQKDTVLFIPFDFWEFQYRNSVNFTPKYTLQDDDNLKKIQGFVGYYTFRKMKIPLLYSPERKRNSKTLLIVNLAKAGKLILYKPHIDSVGNKEIFVDIRTFDDSTMNSIIRRRPDDLRGLSKENKIRKLKQEIGLRVLERYEYKILDTNSIKKFTLKNIGSQSAIS